MSLDNELPPEFIQGRDGRYRIKNPRTGKLDAPWKHMKTGCDDFEHYVRTREDCDEFPYHPDESRELEHKNLWPGRKLRICLVSGNPTVWTEARVASFREESVLGRRDDLFSWRKMWYMKVALMDGIGSSVPVDEIGPGATVVLHGLQLAQEHNMKPGVVTGKMANGRFPVSLFVMHDETTEEEAERISVKPDNLLRLPELEFALFRVNVQGGGLLFGVSQMRPPLVSFEWMERISEEKPWYFVFDPPEAPWRQPFTVDEKIEDIRIYRAEKMEDCLQHENEELVSEKLTELRDHTTESLHLLTRHGGTDGMHEARRLLLTHPLAMVVLVMKKLVSGGYDEEFHLLHAAVVCFFEFWKQTNGFRVVEFGSTEQTVYALAEISDLTHLREWAFTWLADVMERFRALKESRAIIQLFQEWVMVARGTCIRTEMGLIERALKTFMVACDCLCDFESVESLVESVESVVASVGNGTSVDLHNVEDMKSFWTGTSGTSTPLVTSSEAIYSPRRISATLESCVVCGQETEDPYWCKVCGEVPYCSKKCCKDHWSNGGHRRICSLASDTNRLVKPCVVCGKASIVGCNRCMFTYYCSQECQMQHWYEGGHDKSCPRKPLPDP